MAEEQDTVRLDLADYDVHGLTADLVRLADIPSAVATVAKRALVVFAVVVVVTLLSFNGRTNFFVALFVAAGAGVLALGAGVLLGVWRLTRKKGQECVAATDRLVTALGAVHEDLGALPVGQTKGALAALTKDYLSSGSIEAAAAAFLPVVARPFARPLVRPAVAGPKRVVERATLSIIDGLPMERVEKSLAEGGGVDRLADMWEGAHQGVTATVDKVLRVSLVPMLAGVLVMLIPLVLWLAFAWQVT